MIQQATVLETYRIHRLLPRPPWRGMLAVITITGVARARQRTPPTVIHAGRYTTTELWVSARVHSFLATSGPVTRASSGKVAAIMPRAARIPPAVMR